MQPTHVFFSVYHLIGLAFNFEPFYSGTEMDSGSSATVNESWRYGVLHWVSFTLCMIVVFGL